MEISADQQAELNEVIALQNLAPESRLSLSPEQWWAFARISTEFQIRRQTYEAAIARVGLLERNRYSLEVPAYIDAGAQLKAALEVELRLTLGDSTAAEILLQLRDGLEKHFGGFGLSQQSLEFTKLEADGATEYSITRSVTTWEGNDLLGKVVTRTERFLPSVEDRVGHVWGRMLTVLPRQQPRS